MRMGFDLFCDEDGYTSVAVATSLLISVALVFCVASAEWTLSRSADVQEVADATALAASNTIAAFYTIAQVADACVLSLGLTGMCVLGAGLVLAAIPGAQAASEEVIGRGLRILDLRNDFARSVAEGLRSFETLLPGVAVANAWSCAKANCEGETAYRGIAIPLPLQSRSDYSGLDSMVKGEDVADAATRLQEASERGEEAKERADESRYRAWEADCVDNPRCMRTRALKLAGLTERENPHVPDPEQWTFGVAVERTRAYYAQRLASEAPESSDIESVTDSLARAAFYEYALNEVNGAWYQEGDDGSVDLFLPHLACTSNEVKDTSLYTDPVWPCSQEEDGVTLHSTLDCPGATGPFAGTDSVSSVDAGTVRKCPECGMDVSDLGAVARISTIADNGYEHYWQIVVEESQHYQEARNEQAEAERQAQEIAEDGKDSFDRALEQLKVPRPRICPPGAWGCVGVVVRAEGTATPSELTSAFSRGSDLPAGAAVSASALAPDDATNGNSVLSHVFDGIARGGTSADGSLVGSIAGLWGELLVSYGSAYGSLSSSADGFLQKVDGLFGSSVGSWLKRKVSQAVAALGLEPADMRMRKPVLVSPSAVLEQSGYTSSSKIRELVERLLSNDSLGGVARALGVWVWDEIRSRSIVIANLPIPGTGSFVPLSIDLGSLGGEYS